MRTTKFLSRRLLAMPVVALTLALSTVAAVALTSTPASAMVGDVICPAGNQSQTYSPGLTDTPQPVAASYNVSLGICTSLSHLNLTSGTSSDSIHIAQYSCLDLLTESAGSQTFTWNTGQTSTFTFNRTVAMVNGNIVLTLTGAISSGLFTGDSALLTIVEPATDLLACETSAGLTSAAGLVTFVVG